MLLSYNVDKAQKRNDSQEWNSAAFYFFYSFHSVWIFAAYFTVIISQKSSFNGSNLYFSITPAEKKRRASNGRHNEAIKCSTASYRRVARCVEWAATYKWMNECNHWVQHSGPTLELSESTYCSPLTYLLSLFQWRLAYQRREDGSWKESSTWQRLIFLTARQLPSTCLSINVVRKCPIVALPQFSNKSHHTQSNGTKYGASQSERYFRPLSNLYFIFMHPLSSNTGSLLVGFSASQHLSFACKWLRIFFAFKRMKRVKDKNDEKWLHIVAVMKICEKFSLHYTLYAIVMRENVGLECEH